MWCRSTRPRPTNKWSKALAAAAKAHREWSRTSTLAERAALIKQVAKLHTERREELAKIIQREMGKPLDQALGEVDFSAAIYEYYADNAENASGRAKPERRHQSLAMSCRHFYSQTAIISLFHWKLF